MTYRRKMPEVFVQTVLALLILSICLPAWSQKPDKAKKQPKQHKFLRVVKDKNSQPVAMETAIVRFVAAGEKNKGITVELIGAVHVGEKQYYEKLNDTFTKYDALLYELVAPEGKQVPKESSKSVISIMQIGLKSLLGIEHQLRIIDYSKKNFVHADMSPEQFDKSMKDRGESFLKMYLRLVGSSLAQQDQSGGQSDVQLLMALFGKNRKLTLKRLMASQFENMDGMIKAINGPNGSTILTERNKIAIKVLTREIAKGKKNIGIFYGAAHLPDLEKRLVSEFGLKRQSERWIVAWDLKDKTKATTKAETKDKVKIKDKTNAKTKAKDAPKKQPVGK